MWYTTIIQPLLDAKSDAVFVVDTACLTDIPVLRDHLKTVYPEILRYESEIRLRIVLRRRTSRMLIVFRSEDEIPFDFLSSYAVVSVDLVQAFPLFDREALLKIPYENYSFLYEEYPQLTANHYEKFSHDETTALLTPLLASADYKVKKRMLELRTRLETLIARVPKDRETFGEISEVLGELLFLSHDTVPPDIERQRTIIEAEFAQHIEHYYEDFVYDSKLRMHAHLLEQIFGNPREKIALICLDCMGFEEWNVVREYLDATVNPRFDITYSFVMLPSETHYSRITLFAGRFPQELHVPGTSKVPGTLLRNEEKFFRSALENQFGFEAHDIYYCRCSEPRNIPLPFENLGDYSVIGLVFSFIDQLTHNTLITKKMLLDNIRSRLAKSCLDELIASLIKQEFQIFLTSDHGSISVHGNGVHVPKDLTEEHSKRYFLTMKRIIAEEYQQKAQCALVLELKNMLGEEILCILTDDSMFGSKEKVELTHGGISLEEVVVPFIEVKTNDWI